MPVITLPDGSQKRFDAAVSVRDIAASIGAGLAKAALAGKVDGVLVDTSRMVDHDSHVTIVTDRDPEGLEIIRHSTAHLLANAVQELYPDAQVTIGPVIEDGFYYDFAYKRPFSTEDLAAIEKRMAEIAAKDLPVHRREMPRDAAVEHFKKLGEHYKAEIIASIPSNEPISLYGQGARAQYRPAQGLQAHEGGRRLLAR
jgi:threonyl-tRNA synthetase